MSRGIVSLAMALFVATLLATCASADPSASAMAQVHLNIDPNIAVQPLDATVDLGTLQTGDRAIDISFRVDANTEAVSMSALVTKLYKGDNPAGTEVAPIPVNLSKGVVMKADAANPIDGGSNVAEYLTPGAVTTEKGTFEGNVTESIVFESSQKGHFSQNVKIKPTWTNTDEEKPQGQYSGYVVLYAGVVESLPE